MSRIDELIDRLCPDGVEYRALGEVGTFRRGSALQKKDFTRDGVPCLHYGQVHTSFSIATTKSLTFVSRKFAKGKKMIHPGEVFIAVTSEDDEGVGDAVAWLGQEDAVVGTDAYIYASEILDAKYTSYFLDSSSFDKQKKGMLTGTKVRRISDKTLSRIVIPIPPMEVQQEVVRVLDLHTARRDFNIHP